MKDVPDNNRVLIIQTMEDGDPPTYYLTHPSFIDRLRPTNDWSDVVRALGRNKSQYTTAKTLMQAVQKQGLVITKEAVAIGY